MTEKAYQPNLEPKPALQEQLRAVRKRIIQLLFENQDSPNWSFDQLPIQEKGDQATSQVVKVFDLVDLRFDKMAVMYNNAQSPWRKESATQEVLAEVFLFSTLHNEVRNYTLARSKEKRDGKKELSILQSDSSLDAKLHQEMLDLMNDGTPQEQIAWEMNVIDEMENADAKDIEFAVGLHSPDKQAEEIGKFLSEVN